jgi:hypothetical protein
MLTHDDLRTSSRSPHKGGLPQGAEGGPPPTRGRGFFFAEHVPMVAAKLRSSEAAKAKVGGAKVGGSEGRGSGRSTR